MRSLRAVLVTFLVLALSFPILAQEDGGDEPVYFSITSERTYLPGEKIEVGVNSSHVATLEFRVYRVNDAAKFFSQLQDMHNFGGQAPRLPKQEKGMAGALPRMEAPHLGMVPRFHSRTVFARLAARDPAVASGRNCAAEEGTAGHRISRRSQFSTSSNWFPNGNGPFRKASAGKASR